MIERVLELLKEKKYQEIKAIVKEMYPADVAEIFEEIDDTETAVRLFRLLPKEQAAEAFSYMEPDVQEHLISGFTDRELSYILDEMYLDDMVDLVEEMPANVVRRLLINVSHEDRRLLNQYLKYPEDSAGSIMTNEYVYLKRDSHVRDAFAVLRREGREKVGIDTCYVIAADRKLIGYITLHELILADPDALIGDVMNTHVICAHTLDDQESTAKLFSKYDMLSVPVVDEEERLVGIITVDDAMDVMQEESTEDFEKMAGMAPSEGSYLKTPVIVLAKNRIVWLVVLMISAMVTGAMIEKFEAAIAALPLLVSFIPMLMDTGGNSGSQASTMIIRGMALDEIKMSDFFRIWFKEIRVALLCGVTLAILNFLRIWIQYKDVMVAAVVSGTMIVTVCIAKSLGCILPMLAKKLHLDPALMASPMITTLTDACSIFVYFTFALKFLAARL